MHVQNLVVKNANKNGINIQNLNDKDEKGVKEERTTKNQLNDGEKLVEYETWENEKKMQEKERKDG